MSYKLLPQLQAILLADKAGFKHLTVVMSNIWQPCLLVVSILPQVPLPQLQPPQVLPQLPPLQEV